MVLKSGSQIIDVVATNTYSFNAGTGVTAADWTTNAPSASGFAGTRRVVSIDNNVGGDWLQSNTTTNVMNVGTNNGGFVSPAVPSFTYSWSPATDLSSTTIANPVAGPLTGPATVTYTVTVTEAGGCTSTATATINVGQPLSVTAASSNNNFCQNGTATNTLNSSDHRWWFSIHLFLE
ncbi:MAG: hypothetical protein IPL24_05410 [Bacteroidetes bacterium]|nr:hypothetical protein [Bacteroidota bacterium]